MNKSVLIYICKLEGYKTAIKSLHWNADNMSQHKLCDDIAERIAEFQDQVSEVEQSMSGRLPFGMLKPRAYKVTNLKNFVKDVINSAQTFRKRLENMGQRYVGMKSDCESFISDMQRNLYLVDFTIKEDIIRRVKARVDESRPKSIPVDDDSLDKLIGRRPKTMKSRINQVYKIVNHYGLSSRRYTDEHWQAIDDYIKVISSLGCEVDVKPCADLRYSDSITSDGGYCDYDQTDHMPRSKQYSIKISFDDGMTIDGYIKCMACGTMEDPFSAYDTCMVLWPKSSGKLSENTVKVSEEGLFSIVENAVMKILSETPLAYDADNFSGRWNKNGYNALTGNEYGDDYGFLDDPEQKDRIERDIFDDEWEWGRTMTPKEAENDYSWDLFSNKPISNGVGGYYTTNKRGVRSDVDDAIHRRNADKDWNVRELLHGARMMDKWVKGKRSDDYLGDAWEDLHDDF